MKNERKRLNFLWYSFYSLFGAWHANNLLVFDCLSVVCHFVT